MNHIELDNEYDPYRVELEIKKFFHLYKEGENNYSAKELNAQEVIDELGYWENFGQPKNRLRLKDFGNNVNVFIGIRLQKLNCSMEDLLALESKFYEIHKSQFSGKEQVVFEKYLVYLEENEVAEEALNEDFSILSIKDRFSLLRELGVIEFLENKYPLQLISSNRQVSRLLAKIMGVKEGSVKRYVDTQRSNSQGAYSTKEPSEKVTEIISKINSES